MKKLLFVAVLVMASIAAYAQPRAIGANLGGSVGISYQHGFGESNMLDVAAYLPLASATYPGGILWGLGGIVTYDWIDPFNAPVPWEKQGEWHWYMGVGGAGGAMFQIPAGWVGVAGHVGIEYDFWFPLQLSIDWRPIVGVSLVNTGVGLGAGFNTGGLYDGLSLGVRYKF